MQTYPICIVPPEQHYDRCADLMEDLLRYEKARSPIRIANHQRHKPSACPIVFVIVQSESPLDHL